MGPSFLRTSMQRYEGYKQALKKYHIPCDPTLVEEVDLSPEQTFAAVKKLMKRKDAPTAFFTFKNYISLDVIKILKEKFSSRLAKVEIVGFGNLPLIRYLDFKPIASIDENSFEMGVRAAELIFKHITQNEGREERKVQHLKIPCNLIIN